MAVGASHHSAPRRRRPAAARGFSLVEATLSMVIVGVMLAAALSTLGASAKRHRAERGRDQLLPLAHGLMNEVLQAHYEDPDENGRTFGPEPDETAGRSSFDDVDDYHGWKSSPPADRSGATIDGTDGIVRSVTVELVSPAAPDADVDAPTSPADEGLKRVTVEVRREGGVPVRLTALRSRPSAYDREPAVESTYVRWVGLTIQLGEDGTPLQSGVSVLNQVAVGDAP